MTKEQIVLGNIEIAAFMGLESFEDSRYGILYPDPTSKLNASVLGHSGLKYDTSFDWLMPVVEKIETMDYGFKMCRKVVEVYIDSTKEVIIKTKEANRMESLYKAVIQFINYYKTNKI